jgi:hypothetical protein
VAEQGDADLDRLSEVSASDIRRAQAAFRAANPVPVRDLLDAEEPVEGA